MVPIPELKAHAQALPYLGYLLGDTHMTALIAREGVAAIRVPSAERFALHKLMVSQLRTTRDAKANRDLSQAAILLPVLAERHPGVRFVIDHLALVRDAKDEAAFGDLADLVAVARHPNVAAKASARPTLSTQRRQNLSKLIATFSVEAPIMYSTSSGCGASLSRVSPC